MQCWRCRQYGHRTGDKECPLYSQGNLLNDSERQAKEDPMAARLSQHHHNNSNNIDRLSLLKELIADIRREELLHSKRSHKHHSSHKSSKKSSHSKSSKNYDSDDHKHKHKHKKSKHN